MVGLELIQDAPTIWLGMDHMLFGWINRPKKCMGQFNTNYTHIITLHPPFKKYKFKLHLSNLFFYFKNKLINI